MVSFLGPFALYTTMDSLREILEPCSDWCFTDQAPHDGLPGGRFFVRNGVSYILGRENCTVNQTKVRDLRRTTGKQPVKLCDEEKQSFIPSPLCDTLTPENMSQICELRITKENIYISPSLSQVIFLISLSAGVLITLFHDYLVLGGESLERWTLPLNILGALCLGMAAAASMSWAQVMLNVFPAPVGDGSCACYYGAPAKLKLLVFAVPLGLVARIYGRLDEMLLAVVGGDHLLGMSYHLPLRLVRSTAADDPFQTLLGAQGTVTLLQSSTWSIPFNMRFPRDQEVFKDVLWDELRKYGVDQAGAQHVSVDLGRYGDHITLVTFTGPHGAMEQIQSLPWHTMCVRGSRTCTISTYKGTMGNSESKFSLYDLGNSKGVSQGQDRYVAGPGQDRYGVFRVHGTVSHGEDMTSRWALTFSQDCEEMSLVLACDNRTRPEVLRGTLKGPRGNFFATFHQQPEGEATHLRKAAAMRDLIIEKEGGISEDAFSPPQRHAPSHKVRISACTVCSLVYWWLMIVGIVACLKLSMHAAFVASEWMFLCRRHGWQCLWTQPMDGVADLNEPPVISASGLGRVGIVFYIIVYYSLVIGPSYFSGTSVLISAVVHMPPRLPIPDEIHGVIVPLRLVLQKFPQLAWVFAGHEPAGYWKYSRLPKFGQHMYVILFFPAHVQFLVGRGSAYAQHRTTRRLLGYGTLNLILLFVILVLLSIFVKRVL